MTPDSIRPPILYAGTGDLHAGAYDDLVPLRPHALDGAERHHLARLLTGLRLALAGPTDDLAVERRLVALDDVAVIVETAAEHMDEKGARAGARCRDCLHHAVSPGIGGCERRKHPPGHPPAALLPARLDLSEARRAQGGRDGERRRGGLRPGFRVSEGIGTVAPDQLARFALVDENPKITAD